MNFKSREMLLHANYHFENEENEAKQNEGERKKMKSGKETMIGYIE